MSYVYELQVVFEHKWEAGRIAKKIHCLILKVLQIKKNTHTSTQSRNTSKIFAGFSVSFFFRMRTCTFTWCLNHLNYNWVSLWIFHFIILLTYTHTRAHMHTLIKIAMLFSNWNINQRSFNPFLTFPKIASSN